MAQCYAAHLDTTQTPTTMHPKVSDHDFLHSLVQSSDDAIMSKSIDGTVLTWNPAATLMFGYTAEEMIGQKMIKLFPPDRLEEETVILAKLSRGERIRHYKTQRLHKDGHLIDISVTVSPIFDGHNRVFAASKIARDITQQVQAEREIAQFQALVNSSDDAILSKDTQGHIQTWNAAASRMFGYAAEEVLGRHVSLLYPPERRREEGKLMEAVRSGSPVRHFRTSRITQDGRRIFVSVSLSPINDTNGQLIGFSKIVRDLTQEVRQEQQVWQDVHYDSLTGLMNRVGIQNAVDDLIRINQVRGRSIALVYCNLQGFSQINATFSLQVGDQLLRKVGQTLREVIREADDVARTHADHFVVALQGFSNPESIRIAVEKIQTTIEAISQVDGHPVAPRVSLGVAVYPEDGKAYASLIKNAEQAAHAARYKDGSRALFASNINRGEVPEDFFIVQALNQAIAAHQLHLVYQPIVEASTGQVHKAEALLRWYHPELGHVSPAVFIPLAEKYGVIRSLSQWVLRQALTDLASWTGKLGLDFQVSVNRSSHDFNDPEECQREMRDALHEFGLCGENLIVEITEHSLLRSASMTEIILKNYRNLGIGVALDDFGTGYSSLEYLKRYPVNLLKIDKSFVDSLEHNGMDYQLCDGIVSIAKRLGLQVVAEGVETALQADMLRQMGVEFIQGYFHSKPLKAPDLETFVLERRRLMPPAA